MLVDSMEVKGLAVDEELGPGDLDCAYANWQGVHVLGKAIFCFCGHLHLEKQEQLVMN